MLSRTCGGGSTTNMLPRTWPLFSWFVHCMLCVRVREEGEGVRLGEDMSLASLAILSKQKSICQLLPLLFLPFSFFPFFPSSLSLISSPLLFPPLSSCCTLSSFLCSSLLPPPSTHTHTPTHPHTHTRAFAGFPSSTRMSLPRPLTPLIPVHTPQNT